MAPAGNVSGGRHRRGEQSCCRTVEVRGTGGGDTYAKQVRFFFYEINISPCVITNSPCFYHSDSEYAVQTGETPRAGRAAEEVTWEK